MLSDGRLNFFMVIFYIGMLCLLDILPSFNTLALQNSSTKFDTRPIRTFLLALALTFFISMVSILTALELINTKGGLRHIDLFFYPDIYSVSAYEFQRLWKETVGWRRQAGFMTIVIPQKVADKTLFSWLKFVSFDDPRTSNLSSLSEPKYP